VTNELDQTQHFRLTWATTSSFGIRTSDISATKYSCNAPLYLSNFICKDYI